MMHRMKWVLAVIWVGVAFRVVPATAEQFFESNRVTWIVSPLIGADRDELEVHGPRGASSTKTDTGAMYGLYLMAIHPNFIINDFLFETKVNDADVWGNLFYANYYYDAKAIATWNVGVGYLYHEIKPEGITIKVKVPMIKAGPRFSIPSWHMKVNPYVGYAWERVDTSHGDQDNNSYLYGVSVNWRWRMMGASVKYYYQDSQDIDDDFSNIHSRFHVGITKNWGGVIRYDYMEHSASKDQLLLIGPYFMF